MTGPGLLTYLAEMGAMRAEALRLARLALDDIVAAVEKDIGEGKPVNLAACARAAGVTRQTLYDRLPDDLRARAEAGA